MVRYDKIEDIVKELPMTIEKALEIYDLPFLIYRDDWWEASRRFEVTNVARENGKLRVFGHFIENGKREGLKEWRRTDLTFRIEKT